MGLANKNNEVVKFDKVVRTNQADAVLSLIMASYWNEEKETEYKKKDIQNRLKEVNQIFKKNKGGSYGSDPNKIDSQFSRVYTIGHDMGIWINSKLDLSEYSKKVARYEITIKDYISTVFTNLFTYVDGKYVHILYEICKYMLLKKKETLNITDLRKIFETPPREGTDKDKHLKEVNEQANIILNYLLATNFFVRAEKGNDIRLSSHYNWQMLEKKCNLEYQDKKYEEVKEYFDNPENYATYISTLTLNDDDYAQDSQHDCSETEEKASDFTGDSILRHKHVQKIIFGPPGIGKSYSIKSEIRESYPEFEEHRDNPFVFRTTLHPEYDYVNFVGQVMPVVKDDSITYDFKPGIFTESLKSAILHKENDVYLILEEMSRSNVAAVFGDIFQLLDREDGVSEYMINNDLIAQEIYDDPKKKIHLPKNFHIIGTVNASDQNVYVMDTAFKRRFDFSYMDLSPKLKEGTSDYLNSYKMTIKDEQEETLSIDWIEFYTVLNNYIVEDLELGEDKQVGQFFIRFTSNKVQNTWMLIDKLFHYLWDDIQRITYTDNRIFKEELKTFSQVYNKVKHEILKADEDQDIPLRVFSESFVKRLKSGKYE